MGDGDALVEARERTAEGSSSYRPGRESSRAARRSIVRPSPRIELAGEIGKALLRSHDVEIDVRARARRLLEHLIEHLPVLAGRDERRTRTRLRSRSAAHDGGELDHLGASAERRRRLSCAAAASRATRVASSTRSSRPPMRRIQAHERGERPEVDVERERGAVRRQLPTSAAGAGCAAGSATIRITTGAEPDREHRRRSGVGRPAGTRGTR